MLKTPFYEVFEQSTHRGHILLIAQNLSQSSRRHRYRNSMHVNFIIREIDSMSQTAVKVNLMLKYEVDGCTIRLSAQVVITALSAYLITFLIRFLCKTLQR